MDSSSHKGYARIAAPGNKAVHAVFKIVRLIGTPSLVIVFSLFVFSLKPRFLSLQNLTNIAHQIVPVGLIALAQTFVMVSGGIDISTGSVMALSSVTLGIVFGITKNISLAILAALAISLCIGALNSILIAKLELPDMIVTLSTMSISMGLVLVVMGVVERVFFISHPVLSIFGGRKVFGLPYSFLLLLAFFVIGYIVYNYTKTGVYTRALGSNRLSAKLAGIDVARYRIILYLLSAFLSGIGGIIITCRMAIVQPIIGGAMSMLLESIAAVVIGGTSLLGGVGTIQGAFIGVILMGFISNSLNVLNINPNLQDVFRGAVLILILFFDRIIHRLR